MKTEHPIKYALVYDSGKAAGSHVYTYDHAPTWPNRGRVYRCRAIPLPEAAEWPLEDLLAVSNGIYLFKDGEAT